MIIRREIIKKILAVNTAVISLLNIQPPKPAKPPPQLDGAIAIHNAEKIINGIANFFQELNICFFRNININEIIAIALEKSQLDNRKPSPK